MLFLRKSLLILISACAMIGLISGCTSPLSEVNEQIAVEDIRLGMKDSRVQTILGGEGMLAPCVQGYERGYESYSVVVGFDQKKATVRRVATEDPSHQIFGVRPGSGYLEASKVLLEAGFIPEGDSRSKFLLDGLRVTLTTFDEESVDAVTIELRPSGS